MPNKSEGIDEILTELYKQGFADGYYFSERGIPMVPKNVFSFVTQTEQAILQAIKDNAPKKDLTKYGLPTVDRENEVANNAIDRYDTAIEKLFEGVECCRCKQRISDFYTNMGEHFCNDCKKVVKDKAFGIKEVGK